MTFRLGDSVPQTAWDRWEANRLEWSGLRGVRLDESRRLDLDKLSPERRREYMQRFGNWIQDELDQGHGECLLRDPQNRKFVEDTLRFFDGERYALGDFVIMPNHVHVLVVPNDGVKVAAILKSWKQHTTMEINKRLGRSGPLWQSERFDHIVRSKKQLRRIRDYIRENPQVAGLSEGDFSHWAAEWVDDGGETIE